MDDSVVQAYLKGILRAEGSGENEISTKGAYGRWQVLPSTAQNPGFGIPPAKDRSDYSRVGQQYAIALLNHFQDPALASAAYNAGLGKVNQWISQIGDPRSGNISPQEWASRLPVKETRDYVPRVMETVNPQDWKSDWTLKNQSQPVETNNKVETNLKPVPISYPSPNQNFSSYSLERTQNSLNSLLDPSQPVFPGLSPGGPPPQASPEIALRLIQMVLPSTHGLVPVDYNPFDSQTKSP